MFSEYGYIDPFADDNVDEELPCDEIGHCIGIDCPEYRQCLLGQQI